MKKSELIFYLSVLVVILGLWAFQHPGQETLRQQVEVGKQESREHQAANTKQDATASESQKRQLD